jgi:hypothetical protein
MDAIGRKICPFLKNHPQISMADLAREIGMSHIALRRLSSDRFLAETRSPITVAATHLASSPRISR